MKKYYITAVTNLLLQGGDVDAVLKNLKNVLTKKGHLSIYKQILDGVLLKLHSEKRTNTSHVTVAKETDLVTLSAQIQDALQSLEGAVKDAKITTDKTLVGGFIASHGGKLINNSYKQKLVTLYRSLTN